MKVESMITMRADRSGGTFLGGFVVLAAVATLFLTPAAAQGAGPALSGSGGKSTAVTFESIPGSTAKRVILSAKAAERLGIETGRVSEEPIILRQMVSGLVIPQVKEQPDLKPAIGVFGGFQRIGFTSAVKPVGKWKTSPPAGDVWVLVTLSWAEWEKLEKDKPARLLPLDTRDKLEKEIWAQPSGNPPLDDMKRSMLWVYYVVPGNDHGLAPNTRMRVELQLSGSHETRKVVPYGAVYYDGKGYAWVYVNPKPLVFERQRVGVERVVGDLAVLSDGPPVGTAVVTVGAAMLYGAEIFGK
jgi:hypothetical protein